MMIMKGNEMVKRKLRGGRWETTKEETTLTQNGQGGKQVPHHDEQTSPPPPPPSRSFLMLLRRSSVVTPRDTLSTKAAPPAPRCSPASSSSTVPAAERGRTMDRRTDVPIVKHARRGSADKAITALREQGLDSLVDELRADSMRSRLPVIAKHTLHAGPSSTRKRWVPPCPCCP